jgi:hypothetical protein
LTIQYFLIIADRNNGESFEDQQADIDYIQEDNNENLKFSTSLPSEIMFPIHSGPIIARLSPGLPFVGDINDVIPDLRYLEQPAELFLNALLHHHRTTFQEFRISSELRLRVLTKLNCLTYSGVLDPELNDLFGCLCYLLNHDQLMLQPSDPNWSGL